MDSSAGEVSRPLLFSMSLALTPRHGDAHSLELIGKHHVYRSQWLFVSEFAQSHVAIHIQVFIWSPREWARGQLIVSAHQVSTVAAGRGLEVRARSAKCPDSKVHS
jgi:hypothetical protein